MEHDIRVWNNSKFGNLYLLAFQAQRLCSHKPHVAVHAVWLVVGCWFLVLVWIYFFFTFIPPTHRAQPMDWSIAGCWGAAELEFRVRAFAQSKWMLTLWSLQCFALGRTRLWPHAGTGECQGCSLAEDSCIWALSLFPYSVIQELEGIWVLLLK